MDLNVSFLPWQEKVWNSPYHHHVIAAGRRTGKTEYAAWSLLIRALTDGKDAPDASRFYVAPTQNQARRNIWPKLLNLGKSVIESFHINNLEIKLINGQVITLIGADRPENMRGAKIADIVLDEYKDMRPYVLEEIVLPALTDLDGTLTIIGTPGGRNHFYDLFKKVELQVSEDWEEWHSWHFTSFDNPFLPRKLLERRQRTMSSYAFRQEHMASFEAMGSNLFKEEWVKYADTPKEGQYYITVDPAGFDNMGGRKTKNLDDTAICIVKVNTDGWHVEKIIHGRWDLNETAIKIFEAVRHYRPVRMGIERGIAQQAIMSPLQDLMRRKGFFFNLELLSHGNQKKTDRIMWALQGRFENGFITLGKGDWNMKFLDQLFQFPDPLTHDDLVDSLAYIDQIATVTYHNMEDMQDWEMLDDVAGY
jgi:predicted phage terminase large subunit-like protein